MNAESMEGLNSNLIRFGVFEADRATGELRKAGRRIRLQEQPFRILLLLLEHQGEVVSRDELRERIWGETNVDFEEGLNTAVRKLRDALGDSAANPRFIETLPRRGYRFIATAEVVGGTPILPEPKNFPVRRPLLRWAIGGAVVTILASVFLMRVREKPLLTASPPIQLTRDSGLTTEPVISQDGKFLVYASDRAGEGNLDIWIQHTSGGEPRRLTSNPANERQPELSPDGSNVIFRSDGETPGIYSVPTLGGAATLIIKDGYLPRYSPDGLRIAYVLRSSGAGATGGELHLYTVATGTAETLTPGVFVNGRVTWSPDGEFVAFVGSDNPQAHLRGGNLTRILYRPFYLWICSAKTGKATKMRARPIAEDRTLFGQVDMLSVAWFGNQIILSLKQAGSANLWAGTVTPGTHELAGELTRLTLGSGNETTPSVSAGGKLVFANQGYSSGIWEALAGDASAPSMRRITQDRAVNYRPSVSTDGSKLAYVSDRTGNFDVWLKDLASGKDTPVTRSEREELFVAISRDGSQVAFWDGGSISLASTGGGTPRLFCEKCGRPDGWTQDGKVIISPGLDLDSIGVRDPVTSVFTKIISDPVRHTTAPDLSRDGKWLTFHTAENVKSPGMGLENRRQVFIAPYTGQWSPPESWISVTDGSALDREPKWSTDGNRIYFLSDRDGFRCIWARNLDAKTKQPLGSIYPVVHLHDSHLSLLHIPNSGNVSICPVGDKLIFAMGELNGNIWMTDLHQM